jgi:hypothetical protein
MRKPRTCCVCGKQVYISRGTENRIFMQPGPKIKVWIHGRCVKAPQIQNVLKAVERLEQRERKAG